MGTKCTFMHFIDQSLIVYDSFREWNLSYFILSLTTVLVTLLPMVENEKFILQCTTAVLSALQFDFSVYFYILDY